MVESSNAFELLKDELLNDDVSFPYCYVYLDTN